MLNLVVRIITTRFVHHCFLYSNITWLIHWKQMMDLFAVHLAESFFSTWQGTPCIKNRFRWLSQIRPFLQASTPILLLSAVTAICSAPCTVCNLSIGCHEMSWQECHGFRHFFRSRKRTLYMETVRPSVRMWASIWPQNILRIFIKFFIGRFRCSTKYENVELWTPFPHAVSFN
jgi:hypothetical protein